jgi:hypothetical protein
MIGYSRARKLIGITKHLSFKARDCALAAGVSVCFKKGGCPAQTTFRKIK